MKWSVEAERLTRRKHEPDPSILLKRIFRSGISKSTLIGISWPFRHSVLDYRGEQLNCDKALTATGQVRLCGRQFEAMVVAHELAHAAYALFYSGWRPGTLILVNEGRGAFSRNSLFFFDGYTFSLVEKNGLPWFATGFAWSALSLAIGLGRGPSVAGRMMALSGFSHEKSKLSAITALNDVPSDLLVLSREHQELALSRLLNDCGITLSDRYPWDRDHIPAGVSALVASFQEMFTESVSKYLNFWRKKLAARYIALGGGCALNIPTNWALEELNVFVGPACNDSGQSFGVALLCAWQVNRRVPLVPSVYINGFLDDMKRSLEGIGSFRRTSADPYRVSSILAAGGVVAVCRDLGEVGPRSLGNRALLGSASILGMRRRISEELKGREWFRPVAPVITEENYIRQFGNTSLSRYMLTQRIVEGSYDFLEAKHIDGTARVQSVARSDNAFLHEVLCEFEKQGDGKALINTSLNRGGRAMAYSTTDVLDDFPLGMVDAYVLNDDLYVPL